MESARLAFFSDPGFHLISSGIREGNKQYLGRFYPFLEHSCPAFRHTLGLSGTGSCIDPAHTSAEINDFLLGICRDDLPLFA